MATLTETVGPVTQSVKVSQHLLAITPPDFRFTGTFFHDNSQAEIYRQKGNEIDNFSFPFYRLTLERWIHQPPHPHKPQLQTRRIQIQN